MKKLIDSHWLLLSLTLLACGLRFWQLDGVPPGYRIDELSDIFAVSPQQLAGGKYHFFFHDASGHEGLWHAFHHLFLYLLGQTALGARGVSAFFGLLTIPLVYLIGRTLFDKRIGLVAAAALTVSFWGLMYSRTGIRQVSMPFFQLIAFYFFWRGIRTNKRTHWIAAGVGMGLCLNTYFAAWTVPATIIGFLFLALIFRRDLLDGRWRGILWMFALTLLFAIPLVIAMRDVPASAEPGRISEVAKPFHAFLAGDFRPILQNIVQTLRMYHNYGDEEWLYNIPFRPVFPPLIGLIFWIGVIIAVGRTLLNRSAETTFLLIWWFLGIAPAFISVPPASLGHTIASQVAVYLLLALPLTLIRPISKLRPILTPISLLLIGSVAVIDLPDYFYDWPTRGNTRFHYNADIDDVARYLKTRPDLTDFGITGTLAGQWEKLALEFSAPPNLRPRWYNPSRVIFLEIAGQPARNFTDYPNIELIENSRYQPDSVPISAYRFREVMPTTLPETLNFCFDNGWCIVSAEYNPPTLDLIWRITAEPAESIIRPIYSFPPPPGVYDGERLKIFAHLWNEKGEVINGDDTMGVDPATVHTGDLFLQRHHLTPPDENSYVVAVGLYDPATGKRLKSADGSDHYIVIGR